MINTIIGSCKFCKGSYKIGIRRMIVLNTSMWGIKVRIPYHIDKNLRHRKKHIKLIVDKMG
jgi:hypothetical protein